MKDSHEYSEVWRASLPYLRARKNDVHVPISYGYAEELVKEYPDADRDVVLIGILMHDLGWALVDPEAIYRDAFGENARQSDVKRAHEVEGARLARQILPDLGYDATTVDHIARIIDGHDTRLEAISLEDKLVKDADKIWRLSVTGISIICDWFRVTPAEYVDRFAARDVDELFTDTARRLALAALSESRDILKLDLLR